GVVFDPGILRDPEGSKVALAVFLGLLVGKPIGVAALAYLSVAAGLARLPTGVNWSSVLATGFLAGIGFTVALFITILAFENPVHVAGSKIGILAASFA
ncbi:MAG: Na+/H+ antiporter NhaA, partial [Akkermansiaceae bacterium]|nr:Na+/H+ antiporter NhaA [Akkermansiaceae bacterium]